jgi:hypothetical protein
MSRITRQLLLSAAALAVAAPVLSAQGQVPDQDQMKAKYEAKIAEAWFTDGGWTVDFDAAKERAKKENKVVFAYFSRSYSP